MREKIKNIRNKIKKSKAQMENLKLIGELSAFALIVISGIAYFSKYAFFVDGYLQVNEWTATIISLIGALIGGIFTMLGVVFTLNKSISDQEKKNKKELVRLIYLIQMESKLFLESIESYLLNIKLGELIVIKNLNAEFKEENRFSGFYEWRYIISDSYKDNISKISLLLHDDELWIVEKLLWLDSLSRKINNVTDLNNEFPFKLGIRIFSKVFNKDFIELISEINEKEVLASKTLSYGRKALKENMLDKKDLEYIIENCKKEQKVIEDLYNRCKIKYDEMNDKKIHLSPEYEEVFKIIERISSDSNAQ
ncbi:hypothetical protein ACSXCN_08705 [Clostridium perfringens]